MNNKKEVISYSYSSKKISEVKNRILLPKDVKYTIIQLAKRMNSIDLNSLSFICDIEKSPISFQDKIDILEMIAVRTRKF